MRKFITKLSLMSLAVGVGLQVAMPAKAFYQLTGTSSLVSDGQAITDEGRSFITGIVIPYVLPLVLALSVIAFVWYKIKGIGRVK